MSNLFDFIVKNAAMLEDLILTDDGNVVIPVDDFDFSHDDLEIEVDNKAIVFKVTVGGFDLTCTVDIDNLKDSVDSLKKVKSPDTRREIFEMIEDTYRAEAEESRDAAQTAKAEAEAEYKKAQEDFDTVVDSLQVLKGAWGIP
jgi:hypothetical protein